MGDACCGVEEPTARGEGPAEPTSFWAISEVRAAAASGVLLAGHLVAEACGAGRVAVVLAVGALVLGGATFVPSTLRSLSRGRLGVADPHAGGTQALVAARSRERRIATSSVFAAQEERVMRNDSFAGEPVSRCAGVGNASGAILYRRTGAPAHRRTL